MEKRKVWLRMDDVVTDGQVAGLPKNTDVGEYYRRMNEIIRS